jgi:hypothetical protein
LEFRLVYKGRLPAETSRPRVKDKHRIRKHFHRQLKELWSRDPVLKRQSDPVHVITTPYNAVLDPGKQKIYRANALLPRGRSWVEHVADNYARCGFRFVPLIREANGFTCALNILFLRRGHPGELLRDGGDIDNRIKVLFDSLKVPKCGDENQDIPAADENPFFCLLEDDRLITSLTVVTDRLLIPKEQEEAETDVELVVHVTVTDPGILFSGDGLF